MSLTVYIVMFSSPFIPAPYRPFLNPGLLMLSSSFSAGCSILFVTYTNLMSVTKISSDPMYLQTPKVSQCLSILGFPISKQTEVMSKVPAELWITQARRKLPYVHPVILHIGLCPNKCQDKHYDPKANDVWALGILLTKILGIQHPYAHSYADDTSTTVKRRILTGDAKFHWKPDQLVPGGIAELIMGMLERDPQKRWTVRQRVSLLLVQH